MTTETDAYNSDYQIFSECVMEAKRLKMELCGNGIHEHCRYCEKEPSNWCGELSFDGFRKLLRLEGSLGVGFGVFKPSTSYYKGSSYGLKHILEERTRIYVDNSTMILYFIYRNFKVRDNGSLNASVKVSVVKKKYV